MNRFKSLLSIIGKLAYKKASEEWRNGQLHGLEEGIGRGMRASFMATSELSEKEDELLTTFLIRHNFVLCYDPYKGGFRVRKNNKLNPEPEKVISIVDDEAELGCKTVPIVEAELESVKREIKELTKYSPEERKILGIF